MFHEGNVTGNILFLTYERWNQTILSLEGPVLAAIAACLALAEYEGPLIGPPCAI